MQAATARVHEIRAVKWDLDFLQIQRFALPNDAFEKLVESSERDVGEWSDHLNAAKNAGE